MSPFVIATWHTVHAVAITECTDFPLTFAAWHDAHSTSGGNTPGCSTAPPHIAPHHISKLSVTTAILDAPLSIPQHFPGSEFINVASFYEPRLLQSLLRIN